VPYLIFLPDLPGAQPDRMPDLVKAFFTSRGLGVADVSGRGSAGYGRGYREQVYGRWGTADVEDCAIVIRGLVSRWHADPERLALRGADAGGATALGVLAGTDACAAATVYAPVTDLAPPGSATTRYLRQIAADTTLLRSRSWPERIRRPVLMLHGLDDDIVPPDQTARLRDILRGSPCRTHA
jgi:dipeptidyl aminopeptidase/acylaminoacyl peptidase